MAKTLEQLIKQPAGALIDVENALQIQNKEVCRREVLHQVFHHGLDAYKDEMALELISYNPRAEFAQRLAFPRRSHAAGVQLCAVEFQPDHRTSGWRTVKQMKVEAAGNIFANPYPSYAIPVRVQPGRKNSNSELPGQNRNNTTRDSALCRHSYFVDPFAGIIVHSARAHDAQHAFDILAADRLLACNRVHSLVRQGRRHNPEVQARNSDRALLEI